MSKHKFTEEDVAVKDLVVDPKVQRSWLDAGKVERIVAEFNPDAVGRITVSRRKLGEQVMLDGWHRVEAVRRLTDNDGTVPARVFENLTLAEEANMFLKLNNTTGVHSLDKWEKRITSGDEFAAKIAKTLELLGWKIHRFAGKGHLNAIGAVERIQRISDANECEPDLVHITFQAITKAWGHDQHGSKGALIEGIARFIFEHSAHEDFVFSRLVEKLKDFKGGPQTLAEEAHTISRIRRIRPAMAVADILTNEYNLGLKNKALPAWRHRK